MRKRLIFVLAMLCGMATLQARPVDVEQAKEVGRRFISANFEGTRQVNDLQLVYTGLSDRSEACFYVFNAGGEGFVIVSADDRFRPIVGYSDEGAFETENMSPELKFYLERIIEARTSRNAVLFADTEREWQSVKATGKLLSRNGGRRVDYICTTKWNQDSPYNLYAPSANGGPGDRCYAGCVATAMSQVMKRWDHPLQGTGSHSYYCYGHGTLSANFGATTYDWDNMPDRISSSSPQEEIEAVALLMYHCAVAVDMGFSPNGSGANSWDVPYAIRHYFSYSNQAVLRDRESYSLVNWQNMLKEEFDKGWPVYYSGFSNSGGHAFVCDGYDDSDLFHFNWGWGGSSDGWFVIDEIDYADWAQALFNYVPSDVYDYMPLQPENFSVETSNDLDYAATLQWTNPTQNIHLNDLEAIDKIVVTRDGKVIYTDENVTPGASMSFTDHYMPTKVSYAVYAVAHNAKGIEAREDDVILGPTCLWSIEMSPSDGDGWNEGYISLRNSAGIEIGQLSASNGVNRQDFLMPVGHVRMYWNNPSQAIEQLSFRIKDAGDNDIVSFEGSSSNMPKGLFFIANNTCGKERNHNAPKNLTVTRDGDFAALQWEAAEGQPLHYLVYRDHLIYAMTESTNFTDEALDNSFHSYYVTAVSDTGESDPSNVSNLQAELPCEAPSDIRFEMVNNKVKVSWDAPQEDGLTGYYLFRRAQGEAFKRIKSLTNTSYSDNINTQGANIYDYAVAAYYSANQCTSAYANAQANPELNFVTVNKTSIPQGLSLMYTTNGIVLTWETALMADSYNVYRNGERIAQGITETSFTDDDSLAQQTYIYTVTGQTAFMESSPSNEAILLDPTAVSEISGNQEVSIYPNPTSGKVLVEGNNLTQAILFNLMGQEIMRQTTNNGHIIFDLTDLPQGIYFINTVGTRSGITTKVVKIQ